MLSLSQAFEDKWKAKRASAKRSARGSMEGEPPKKAAQGPHPEEDVRTRGFDRGLQPEKVIGATDSSGELVSSGNNVIQGPREADRDDLDLHDDEVLDKFQCLITHDNEVSHASAENSPKFVSITAASSLICKQLSVRLSGANPL